MTSKELLQALDTPCPACIGVGYRFTWGLGSAPCSVCHGTGKFVPEEVRAAVERLIASLEEKAKVQP